MVWQERGMNTESQPAKIKAGHINNGGDYDALAGGKEIPRLLAEYVALDQCMPALELGLIGSDGTSYAGPLFSLC